MTQPSLIECRNASRIRMERAPASEAAIKLTECAAGLIAAHVEPERTRDGTTRRPIGPAKRARITQDLGLILGGILMGRPVVSAQRGKSGERWRYAAVGYDRFWSLLTAMERAELVGTLAGTAGLQVPGAREGYPTRIWPTDRLETMAAECGLPDDGLDEHWTLSKVAQSVPRVVKQADLVIVDRLEGWHSPMGGDTLGAHKDAMTAQVARLNAHVATASYEGFVFPVFTRRFGGDLRLGGRLYAIGGENYQNMSKRHRAGMRINGERIVSVDATASQLSIFAHLTGMGRLPDDPYALPGIPRDVVKTFCVQSFGNGTLMKRWGEDTRPAISAFNVTAVRAAVLKAYPAFADLTVIVPDDMKASPPPKGIEWAAGQHLVYRESEAIVAAVDFAARYGVPALPLHDALLVPESGVEIAKKGILGGYSIKIGFQPRIKTEPFDKAP